MDSKKLVGYQQIDRDSLICDHPTIEILAITMQQVPFGDFGAYAVCILFECVFPKHN